MDHSKQECDRGILHYRRYLAGDDDGLACIIQEYGDRLLQYIYRFVHDTDVAEDLLSETFLKLILHRRRFREESSLKTYLYAIGRNEALAWLRRHRRERKVPLNEAAQVSVACVAYNKVIDGERRAQIAQAMSVLREEYREVLQLVYFDDLSCDEAAVVMHKNRKQTENLLYRGKKALRSQLEKEGFSYEDL